MTNQFELLVKELASIQSLAQSLALQIEVLISRIELMQKVSQLAAVETTSGGCPHPKEARRAAPLSGRLDRYFCTVCKEVVNDEKVPPHRDLATEPLDKGAA